MKTEKTHKQLLKEFIHSMQPIGMQEVQNEVDLSVLEAAGFNVSNNLEKNTIKEAYDPVYINSIIETVKGVLPKTALAKVFYLTLVNNKTVIKWDKFIKSFEKYFPNVELPEPTIAEPEEETDIEDNEE